MVTSESLQQAFRYLFPDEVKALKDLARSLPPNPIVCNIGAGAGTSGLAFMESRGDLILHTADIQYEDSPFGCLVAEEKVLKDAGLWKIKSDHSYYKFRNYHHWGDSKKMGQNLQGILNDVGFYWPKYEGQLQFKVDLVFIDGDHSYNGCKGDILAWLPNIKPGGIMAVHDFNKREVYKDGPIEGAPHPLPWPGVDRAVRKFLCPKYEIVLQEKTLIAFRIR